MISEVSGEEQVGINNNRALSNRTLGKLQLFQQKMWDEKKATKAEIIRCILNMMHYWHFEEMEQKMIISFCHLTQGQLEWALEREQLYRQRYLLLHHNKGELLAASDDSVLSSALVGSLVTHPSFDCINRNDGRNMKN